MKYSIIVPVHNVEEYIDECITSILKQEENDFEAIFIINSSQDRSGDIVKEYAKDNSNIVVLETDTPGVSNARNMGLKVAKGDWVVFVDSDDYIYPNMLKKFSTVLSENDELLVCNMSTKKDEAFSEKKGTISSLECRKILLDKHGYYGKSGIQLKWKSLLLDSPTCKAYKASVIRDNSISFDVNVKIGEDFLFNMNYLSHISEVKTYDTLVYYYRTIRSSASRSASNKGCIDRIDFVEALHNLQIDERLNNFKETKYVDILLRTVFILAKIKGDKKEAKEAILTVMDKDYMKDALKNARDNNLNHAKRKDVLYRAIIHDLKSGKLDRALSKVRIYLVLIRILKR